MSVQINVRIPDELSDEMEEWIDGYEIRDRSQFVILAIRSYLQELADEDD